MLLFGPSAHRVTGDVVSNWKCLEEGNPAYGLKTSASLQNRANMSCFTDIEFGMAFAADAGVIHRIREQNLVWRYAIAYV